ncbi:helix-turn-helix transcriptional regulator [Streptomyces sp. NPDC006638]|uniref:helix-turn-helix domain-containing protein n=1 Tax=Streptomyces sp. NPDC006638 TaxID=3157183 RepID=UPI0033BD0DBB
MPQHPSATVRQAREALAARLRDLRLDAGISGRELAVRCAWSESKTSRIENARTQPSDADIRSWCVACRATDRSEDLVAANRQSTEANVEWRRLQRSGLRNLQEAGAPLYESTERFRVYCSDVVPGFLQTSDYAAALLTSIMSFRGVRDDVEEAVAARLRRNRVVHEERRRFSFVMEESVLRYRIGNDRTMSAQLDHLLSFTSRPNVALGVIPFSVRRTMWPLPTFTVFDAERVHADTLDAAVTLTQPSQVDLYAGAFDLLARHSAQGEAARKLISDAAESLRRA